MLLLIEFNPLDKHGIVLRDFCASFDDQDGCVYYWDSYQYGYIVGSLRPLFVRGNKKEDVNRIDKDEHKNIKEWKIKR